MQHPLDLFKYCPKCGSQYFIINNFKSKRCEDCGFSYYLNPSAATAAFITDKENRLLVAKRAKDPFKGTFDLPGGFVDFEETGEEAIKREIMEEIGVNIDQVKYIFSLPNIYLYSGFQVPTLDMFFECKVDDISKISPHDDVEELFFLKKDEINPEQFGLQSIRKAVKIWLNK